MNAKLATTAEGLWQAIREASSKGVVAGGGAGLLYPVMRIVGARERYTLDSVGALNVLDEESGGIAVRVATNEEADSFACAICEDRVVVALCSRPGFGSGYQAQQVLQVLHAPAGLGFVTAGQVARSA